MDHPNSLRLGLSEIVKERLHDAEHLTLERILAYQRGEATPQEEAAIVEHLGLCADCSELALDAAAFFETPAADEVVPPEESALIDHEWRRLREALDAERSKTEALDAERTKTEALDAERSGHIESKPLRFERPRPPLHPRLGFAYALAATFAAVAGLSTYLALGSAGKASRIVFPTSLEAGSEGITRGDEEIETIEISASAAATTVHWIPNRDKLQGNTSARFRLRFSPESREARPLLETEPLGRFDQGAVATTFLDHALRVGTYRVELVAQRDSREVVVGVYRLVVVP